MIRAIPTRVGVAASVVALVFLGLVVGATRPPGCPSDRYIGSACQATPGADR